MIQGWSNDNYLIVFEEQLEAVAITERYGLLKFLPGFTLVGLIDWDSFVLRDADDRFYTVPTVPLVAQHLKPFTFDIDLLTLRSDSRFTDKIKWHIQPIIFGGNPQSEQNMIWITLDQHTEAVIWWNNKYRELQ
jgi:hypothetical protein